MEDVETDSQVRCGVCDDERERNDRPSRSLQIQRVADVDSLQFSTRTHLLESEVVIRDTSGVSKRNQAFQAATQGTPNLSCREYASAGQ